MLVRRSGGKWEQPEVRAYAEEAELQALIMESPGLVAEIDEGSAVAVREVALPEAGFLDVLVIHRSGDLTLVEAKLNRNPEIRRAVVGQLLGYAGGLWRLGYDQLDDLVTTRAGQPLVDLLNTPDEDGVFDADVFRRAVARNLSEGNFRLVFAVDEITEDLKRAVEYLNAHTVDGTEVVVLELDYSKVGDIEILIPRSFGEESARQKRASRGRRRWTEEDLFQALESEVTPNQIAAVRRLYDWAEPRVHHFFWGEGQSPSVTLAFETDDGMIQPYGIYTGRGGGVAVNFEWMRRRPRAALEMVLDRTSDALPTVARIRDEVVAKDFAKRPTVPYSELTLDGAETMIDALEHLLTFSMAPSGDPAIR